MDVDDYGELRDLVDDSGNVLTCHMWDLRDLQGRDTLGSRVVKNISDELDRVGLGHVPLELKPSGGEKVRLFTRGSEVGDLIVKALYPGEAQDEGLRKRVQSSADQKLKEIREIVCEGEPEEES